MLLWLIFGHDSVLCIEHIKDLLTMNLLSVLRENPVSKAKGNSTSVNGQCNFGKKKIVVIKLRKSVM